MNSVILHFDFDCFYASCFEKHDPKLKTLPLAVQQKQIVVTCNYIARAKGLRKLGLIYEAKKQCPNLVIVNGEDLTLFRDESKENFLFLAGYAGQSKKVERLGFDEVFFDATELIEFNMKIWGSELPEKPFFRLSPSDPESGFHFDPLVVPDHVYPPLKGPTSDASDIGNKSSCELGDIPLPILLGSHLASYLRRLLISERGFTCSAGICDTKLSSKLAGNLHKPDSQTLLLPGHVQPFLDTHEIGKLSGIGFKTASILREEYFKDSVTGDTSENDGVLEREHDVVEEFEEFEDGDETSNPSEKSPVDQGQVETNYYGKVKRSITVADARTTMTVRKLESLLGLTNGRRIWDLLHGIDKSSVAVASAVPTQVSIEDTFRAGTMTSLPDVEKALIRICQSLVHRMRADLLQKSEGEAGGSDKWLCFAKTLRVSSRDRIIQPKYGPRSSKSAPMPNFVFSLKLTPELIATRLVKENAMPLFKKINGGGKFDLALLNVCAANMADGETGNSGGNVSEMFKRYGEMFPDSIKQVGNAVQSGNEVAEELPSSENEYEDGLLSDDDDESWQASQSDSKGTSGNYVVCKICNVGMPLFAIGAHERFHKLGDG